MFGYVTANMDSLSEEQRSVYRAYYCGLCGCLGKSYGYVSRAALNYDMTFLVLLLSSLYDSPEETTQIRCIAHPLHTHSQTVTAASEYAAAMNVALAYYNCLDNWHDDRALKSLFMAKMFQRDIANISQQHKSQCDAITKCVKELSEIEARNIQEPDQGANAFGALLGEIFSWKQDHWSGLLFQLGSSLGRFIYLMDAVLDLPKDIKTGAYNPFRSRWSDDFQIEDFSPILKIVLGECTDAFERLPLVQNVDLMRNILYSGVWIKFYQSKGKLGKEGHHV